MAEHHAASNQADRCRVNFRKVQLWRFGFDECFNQGQSLSP